MVNERGDDGCVGRLVTKRVRRKCQTRLIHRRRLTAVMSVQSRSSTQVWLAPLRSSVYNGAMTADQLRRIRNGDISAFEEVFRKFHAPLCEVVDSYVRSQSVAEDIVQDLFFAVWLKRESLAVASLQGYLFRAARNRALHHLRHRSIVRRVSGLLDSRPEVSGIAGAGQLPDAVLDSAEQQRLLRLAIDRLPARTRLALILRLDHHMNDREIADAMGITTKGVEKLITIAKRHLREQFAVRPELGQLAQD